MRLTFSEDSLVVSLEIYIDPDAIWSMMELGSSVSFSGNRSGGTIHWLFSKGEPIVGVRNETSSN